MRRWNGWGHLETEIKLPKTARLLLKKSVAPGWQGPDSSFEDAVLQVPPSRLPEHRLIERDPEIRLLHSRGQSLFDWVALRHGYFEGRFCDGVARPTHLHELRQVLDYARQTQARLIPYGGGTSVVGHIDPPAGDQPVLTVSMQRMNRLLRFDPTARLATFEAGVAGPDLEAALRARGFTLGHFPQSFEFSTLGGWIATRSSGQQSLGYGRIEDLFAGGFLLTPRGDLDLASFPASAAGPDLRHLVLGSEGRLGIVAEATVRISPWPRREAFHSIIFRDWAAAVQATRDLACSTLSLTMMRLSDAAETAVQLGLSSPRLKRLFGEGSCMLLIGLSSSSWLQVGVDFCESFACCLRHGGRPFPLPAGNAWKSNRFRGPYLRNELWEIGYAVDTLETCLNWTELDKAKVAVEEAILAATEGESLIFSHLSHFYSSGCSLYTTIVYPRFQDPVETNQTWKRVKQAAGQATVAHGGTISHQHGVGLLHRDFMEAEKGKLGLRLLRQTVAAADPDQQMNPGKLLPPE